jgi:hypothetical protein
MIRRWNEAVMEISNGTEQGFPGGTDETHKKFFCF